MAHHSEAGKAVDTIRELLQSDYWTGLADRYLTVVLKEKEVEPKRKELLDGLALPWSSPVADRLATRQQAGDKLREWKAMVRPTWLSSMADVVLKHDIDFGEYAKEEECESSTPAANAMLSDACRLLEQGIVDNALRPSRGQALQKLSSELHVLSEKIRNQVAIREYTDSLGSMVQSVVDGGATREAVDAFVASVTPWAETPAEIVATTVTQVTSCLEFVAQRVPQDAEPGEPLPSDAEDGKPVPRDAGAGDQDGGHAGDDDGAKDPAQSRIDRAAKGLSLIHI